MTEEWRPIPNLPHHSASTYGRIRRDVPPRGWIKTTSYPKVLSPSITRGYERVSLKINGQRVSFSVHGLVASAFHGERPENKQHCAHKNGVRNDNRPDNLYWATAKENSDDKDRHGTMLRGDKHWTRVSPHLVPRGKDHYRKATGYTSPNGESIATNKLSKADVISIRSEPTTRGSGKRLAEQYGVSMGLISAIRKRRCWVHLS